MKSDILSLELVKYGHGLVTLLISSRKGNSAFSVTYMFFFFVFVFVHSYVISQFTIIIYSFVCLKKIIVFHWNVDMTLKMLAMFIATSTVFGDTSSFFDDTAVL